MRALIIGLLAGLVIALGASLYWGIRQHRELLVVIADDQASRLASGDLETRLTASDQARAAAEASLQGQRALNIRRMSSVGDPNVAPEDVARFYAAVDADPLWAPFFQKLEWRRVMSRYNLLLNALQIPPRKLATLKNLLVQRAIEARRISRQQRVPTGRPGAPEALAGADRATDDIDARIETLIGSDAARAVKEWNSAVYAYGNAPDGPASQDAVTLAEAGFTLTNDQLVRLALIRYEIRAETPGVPQDPGGPKPDPQAGLTRQNERLLAREAEVLSPDELTVLRNWAGEEQRARAELEVLRAKYHIVPEHGRPVGSP